MTKTNENLKKGGKKGGATFPRYSLKHLSPLLKTLVSKTHTNAIDIAQLSAGVFGLGANSPIGKIKSSALRQFGLLEGDFKKLKATELCLKISIAHGEEQKALFQEAFKNSKIFINTFNTFQSSSVEKAKIGQYAISSLKVHPDMKDDFVLVFVESAEISGLCSVNGTSVNFHSISAKAAADLEEADSDTEENEHNEEESDEKLNTNEKLKGIPPFRRMEKAANINVNIDIDPSMDPEKLEKLLKLLKGYGAI